MSYATHKRPQHATRVAGGWSTDPALIAAPTDGGVNAIVAGHGGFGGGWPATRRVAGYAEPSFAAPSDAGTLMYTEGRSGFGSRRSRGRVIRRVGDATSDLSSDAEDAAATAINSVVPGLGTALSTVASVLGSEPPEDMTAARTAALQQLVTAAEAGDLNGAQQLWNWANNPGSQYPHGAEPTPTLPVAQQILQQWQEAYPLWAQYVRSAGGKNGDPVPGTIKLAGNGYSTTITSATGVTIPTVTSTTGTGLMSTVAGLPLVLWLAMAAGGGLLLLSRKK